MKILIDTHIFLWSLSEPHQLSPKQIEILESPRNIIYLSAISVAEIAIKRSIGKLLFNLDAVEEARKSGFECLAYSAEAAALLTELPLHHRDPFDRMLITQSLATGMPIMTADNKFALYDCPLV